MVTNEPQVKLISQLYIYIKCTVTLHQVLLDFCSSVSCDSLTPLLCLFIWGLEMLTCFTENTRMHFFPHNSRMFYNEVSYAVKCGLIYVSKNA